MALAHEMSEQCEMMNSAYFQLFRMARIELIHRYCWQTNSSHHFRNLNIVLSLLIWYMISWRNSWVPWESTFTSPLPVHFGTTPFMTVVMSIPIPADEFIADQSNSWRHEREANISRSSIIFNNVVGITLGWCRNQWETDIMRNIGIDESGTLTRAVCCWMMASVGDIISSLTF